ncbi:hypothetical protein Mag101_05630 [Microbulbifer agarilyticus]|uniref:Uncharacterized protein n=1 Tax=Microbulbifer agarilyticus TaxID=260552 RepID=A0A1Q2M368_9GAMM|nr:hypothetical protein [Microbulbifer agarilyticus]AQQ67174.1 hypothetical protein Mag101_05630 [Microbulbifer agarilyticus]
MDEGEGYLYLSNTRMNAQSLKLLDRELSLRVGVHVVADVKTGKNIYEYFIKPVRQSLMSSFGGDSDECERK